MFVFSMSRAFSLPAVRCGKPCRRLNFLKAFSPTAAGASSLMGKGTAHESGFTLLELLTVIVLLGIMAGIAVVSYDGVQEQALCEATRFEMAELRKALLQFRRDSGTNDFPGQGQYGCDPDMDFPLEAGTGNARIDWCKSEANFWMLFVDPLDNGWDPDTHRGWHGPYLQRKSGLISYEGVDDVWGITDPYQSPFILVDLGDDKRARIVSFGPNKIYDGEGANPCEPSTGSDDIVLYLLR